MMEYKKKVLEERNLCEAVAVHIKKARKEYRCPSCLKMIKVGEVYYCHEHILSYYVDFINAYHLNCISNEDIVKYS